MNTVAYVLRVCVLHMHQLPRHSNIFNLTHSVPQGLRATPLFPQVRSTIPFVLLLRWDYQGRTALCWYFGSRTRMTDLPFILFATYFSHPDASFWHTATVPITSRIPAALSWHTAPPPRKPPSGFQRDPVPLRSRTTFSTLNQSQKYR
jgi:hypothetical protein